MRFVKAFKTYQVYLPGFSNTEPPKHDVAIIHPTEVVGMHPQYKDDVLHVDPGLQYVGTSKRLNLWSWNQTLSLVLLTLISVNLQVASEADSLTRLDFHWKPCTFRDRWRSIVTRC
jgi:hypothetical protein